MKKYKNPIIPGFYPDPSVCYGNGRYYLVTSTFEYFPGIPIFKSNDLVNWEKIGHCLDRESQLNLSGADTSEGIFAPTIRYNNGWFYVITTNISTGQNFFVKSQEPENGWSEPVIIESWTGIDPSLFFDGDGKTYIQGNSYKSNEKLGIYQAEIDLSNGKLLSQRKLICEGTGGKAPEAPHIYKKDEFYYLLMAEGGTEYGHMSTIFRSKNINGPYESAPSNPLLSNRSTPLKIQCIGHADMIEDTAGNWWAVCLGVRINGSHSYYHHLGRETFLVPIKWEENQWPSVSNKGVVDFIMNGPLKFEQKTRPQKKTYNFKNINYLPIDFVSIRNKQMDNYILKKDKLILKGTNDTLDSSGNVTFLAHRQSQFHISFKVVFTDISNTITFGITTFMSKDFHYDCIVQNHEVIFRKKIGSILTEQSILKVDTTNGLILNIESDEKYYTFYVEVDGEKKLIGYGECAFLSSEISGTFTGVMLGIFCYSNIRESVSISEITYEEKQNQN